MLNKYSAALVAAAAIVSAGQAVASPVNATLSAYYFKVAASGNGPDFAGSGTPNVLAGSHLGLNGFPVVTTPYGVTDVDPTTHELTWWSPTLNAAVVSTSVAGATITLPYASNMFAPNSTGSNNSSFFETAYFVGNFSLASAATVSFALGSDDDSFIYVDDVLIGQNPGIHATTNVNFTSPTLAAGSHSVKVFYDDRQHVAAFLSLNLNSTDVVITAVPEPVSIALLGAGLLGLGAVRRRRA